MSVQFLLTSLLVVITPGTGVLYVMATAISRGARTSVIAAFGCTLGIVPHMLAAITGLAALLNTSPVAFEVLKYLGVAYLLYMAWNTLRDKNAITVDDSADSIPALRMILHGIMINLLNPKLTIFFFAFLPQFVSPTEQNSFLHLLGLSGIFMVLTFVVFVGYGAFAASIRQHVISRPKVMTWMRRTFAGTFAVLGLSLLAFSPG